MLKVRTSRSLNPEQLQNPGGTYTEFCAPFEQQCFNACGLNFEDNFIYCVEKDGDNLMRLDCGRGKSCYLGKIGSTFSANFDPNTGEYVMTTQSQFVIADNPKNLPCLGAPSNTFVPGRRVVTQSVTDSTDADLMVTDLNQFGITGLPNVGQSWVVTCQC